MDSESGMNYSDEAETSCRPSVCVLQELGCPNLTCCDGEADAKNTSIAKLCILPPRG